MNDCLEGAHVYASLCLLYTVLGSLCNSYCNCYQVRSHLMPAIGLCFHYLYMKSMYTPFQSVFLYSRKENEYDDIVLSFVSECTPFFSIFSSVPVVSFPENNETADLSRVSEEYLDILGTNSLDFIVVSSLFCVFL